MELLDTDSPLTVVRGACGAGKTVVLREWLQRTLDRALWITADPDQSGSSALAGMILLRLTGEALTEGTSTERAWRVIRDRLAQLDESLTLFVDDAAALDREALLALCETVATTPSLRVIAAANRRTLLDSDAVALQLDRTVITPADLMFDREEIRRILGVGSDEADEVLTATNGFPAVIHALARNGIADDPAALPDAAIEAVEEYLRFRVERSGYDPDLISALARISVAETVDESLARELSGDPRAARFLDSAESYGFGEWSSAAPRSFRFVPFARALLRRELERRQPGDVAALMRAAVDGALRVGTPLEALRAAVEADDLPLARRVVMSCWYQLLDHGSAVRELLGGVPLAKLRAEPLLVMLLAICYNAVRVRRLRGLQLFRLAVSAANSTGSDVSDADRIFIWVAESVALRVLGLHERAGTIAARALRLLADIPEEEKDGYASQVPLLCAQLGISLYYGGNPRQAIECFSFGAAVAASGAYEQAFSNLSMLSGIHALGGDLPEARHYVQLIRDGKWTPRQLDGYQGTFYRVAEALLALEESDAATAARHVAVFEPHRATSEHWIAMARVDALVSVGLGQAALGSARLESLVEVRGREGHSAHARRALSQARILLFLAQGKVPEAKAVLHKDAPDDRFETVVERARVALIDGRPQDALRILGQARVRPSTTRLRASAESLRLAALIRTGGPSVAESEAGSLAALLCDRGLRLPLALLPPSDACAVQELVHKVGPSTLEPVPSLLPQTVAAPSLTDRETVVLRALASGRPLSTIATDLGVSLNTVKTQAKSVYRKLGVAGREEAVAAATARHLLIDNG